MYGSRKKCVKLELYFVDANVVEGVAERTERLSVSSKIRVRFRVQADFFWHLKVIVDFSILLFFIIFIFSR